MVTRARSGFLGIAVVCALTALTSACDKVPLLAPSGSLITLTASTTALPVNGSTVLIAQIIEASGTPPHSGTRITFSTTLGTVEPSSAETDANGQAIVTFKAGTANGTATISAISGGASASGANAVRIAVGTAAVGRVTVAASPSLIPAVGGSSTIATSVFDINGNALPSAPVSLSTTAGTIEPTFGTTDANGVMSATLRTSTKATVTASVGAQGGATTPPASGTPTTPTLPTSGQASGSVTVDVAGAPGLVITPPSPPPTSGLPATFNFVITAAANNASAIRDLTVNWGDGTNQDLGAVTGTAAVSHTYRSAGSYTITGTVLDSSGNSVTVSTTVTVNQTQLLLSITPPSTPPTAGQPATVSVVVGALPVGDSVRNVRIEWGDGSGQDLGAVSGSTTVSHVYQSAGSYNVTGTLSDTAGNTITSSTTIVVTSRLQPVVSITSSTTNPTAGTDVTFTAGVTPATGSGTTIQNATIDFGDNTSTSLGPVSGTGIAVHHVYQNAGTYSVVLTATDSNGGVGTATTTVFVQAQTPLGVFLSESKTFSGGNTIESFTATVIGLGNSVVVNYFWTFDPGVTQSTGTNQVTHTYATGSGGRTVTVTITTSTGATATGSVAINP